MGIPFDTSLRGWSPDSYPIDSIFVNGNPSPGYAEIVGLSAPRKLQIQAGFGWNDALVRFAGFDAQKFSVKIHLYDSADWIAWHTWKMPLAKRVETATSTATNRKIAQAMSIWHPFLADPLIAVSAVIVEDVLAPVRGDESGEWIIEIKFVSYRKPIRQYLPYEKKAAEGETDAKALRIQSNANEIAALTAQRLPAPGAT